MSAAYVQANTNGRLHPADQPSVSPLDRGFLYGDAVYEVWRTHDHVVFAWDEHWARLEVSARALHLDLPGKADAMLAEIRRTVAAFRAATRYAGEVYIRLQISRGAGSIGLDVALADRPEFVVLVQPCPAHDPAKLRTGLRLSIATELRRNPFESLSPAWKTGNYLNNILGLREARARGADEVVMLNLRGEIAEASTSNIAFVRDDAVLTPPLGAGILGGITRRLLLEQVAPAAGVPVRETTVTPAGLDAMTECFLLSSTKDITPVAAIDAHRFNVGPEAVTSRISDEFTRYARAYAAAHPALRV
ncbi:MAG TPA: aminotransferase class IV [Opitutaceae bacterium]|nr:aminotransferase class IV [Opitutaceae bacterium]